MIIFYIGIGGTTWNPVRDVASTCNLWGAQIFQRDSNFFHQLSADTSYVASSCR